MMLSCGGCKEFMEESGSALYVYHNRSATAVLYTGPFRIFESTRLVAVARHNRSGGERVVTSASYHVEGSEASTTISVFPPPSEPLVGGGDILIYPLSKESVVWAALNGGARFQLDRSNMLSLPPVAPDEDDAYVPVTIWQELPKLGTQATASFLFHLLPARPPHLLLAVDGEPVERLHHDGDGRLVLHDPVTVACFNPLNQTLPLVVTRSLSGHMDRFQSSANDTYQHHLTECGRYVAECSYRDYQNRTHSLAQSIHILPKPLPPPLFAPSAAAACSGQLPLLAVPLVIDVEVPSGFEMEMESTENAAIEFVWRTPASRSSFKFTRMTAAVTPSIQSTQEMIELKAAVVGRPDGGSEDGGDGGLYPSLPRFTSPSQWKVCTVMAVSPGSSQTSWVWATTAPGECGDSEEGLTAASQRMDTSISDHCSRRVQQAVSSCLHFFHAEAVHVVTQGAYMGLSVHHLPKNWSVIGSYEKRLRECLRESSLVAEILADEDVRYVATTWRRFGDGDANSNVVPTTNEVVAFTTPVRIRVTGTVPHTAFYTLVYEDEDCDTLGVTQSAVLSSAPQTVVVEFPPIFTQGSFDVCAFFPGQAPYKVSAHNGKAMHVGAPVPSSVQQG